MSPLEQAEWASDGPELAACCLIVLPSPDTQHENPRDVGKGRFVTRCSHS
jgi:hypothetical protein